MKVFGLTTFSGVLSPVRAVRGQARLDPARERLAVEDGLEARLVGEGNRRAPAAAASAPAAAATAPARILARGRCRLLRGLIHEVQGTRIVSPQGNARQPSRQPGGNGRPDRKSKCAR